MNFNTDERFDDRNKTVSSAPAGGEAIDPEEAYLESILFPKLGRSDVQDEKKSDRPHPDGSMAAPVTAEPAPEKPVPEVRIPDDDPVLSALIGMNICPDPETAQSHADEEIPPAPMETEAQPEPSSAVPDDNIQDSPVTSAAVESADADSDQDICGAWIMEETAPLPPLSPAELIAAGSREAIPQAPTSVEAADAPSTAEPSVLTGENAASILPDMDALFGAKEAPVIQESSPSAAAYTAPQRVYSDEDDDDHDEDDDDSGMSPKKIIMILLIVLVVMFCIFGVILAFINGTRITG